MSVDQPFPQNAGPPPEPGRELADRAMQALVSVMADLSPLERAVLALTTGFSYSDETVAGFLDIDESEVRELREALRQKTAAAARHLQLNGDDPLHSC